MVVKSKILFFAFRFRLVL